MIFQVLKTTANLLSLGLTLLGNRIARKAATLMASLEWYRSSVSFPLPPPTRYLFHNSLI
jgi:hypothetical protein